MIGLAPVESISHYLLQILPALPKNLLGRHPPPVGSSHSGETDQLAEPVAELILSPNWFEGLKRRVPIQISNRDRTTEMRRSLIRPGIIPANKGASTWISTVWCLPPADAFQIFQAINGRLP